MPKPKSKVPAKIKSSKGLIKVGKLKFDRTLVAVIALVVVATGGYLFYQASHAAAYTYIGKSGNVTATACKTYTTAYGGVYQVKALFTKSKSSVSTPYYLSAIRNNQPVTGQAMHSSSYWNGVVGSATTNASRYYGDKIIIIINGFWGAGGLGTWASPLINPATLVNC